MIRFLILFTILSLPVFFVSDFPGFWKILRCFRILNFPLYNYYLSMVLMVFEASRDAAKIELFSILGTKFILKNSK